MISAWKRALVESATDIFDKDLGWSRKLRWEKAFGSGGATNDDNNLMYLVRLQWNPLGKKVGFSGADLARSEAAFSLALAGVTNRSRYDIRVVNLSFSAPPQSHYWDDPLNQAVMAAWQAGIVVVASAGNRGPDPLTIGVPGNVPYIITVGAMSIT